jgi:hypothetical protein
MLNSQNMSAFHSVEVVNIFTKDGIVKVLGTAVCVSGALLMAFYRGPSLVGLGGANSADQNVLAGTWSSSSAHPSQWLTSTMLQYGMGAWHLGILCLIGNCFLMGVYLVMQVYLQNSELTFHLCYCLYSSLIQICVIFLLSPS